MKKSQSDLEKSKLIHTFDLPQKDMPEIICPDCGKRMFHENEDTLKIEESVHKKFCLQKEGATGSYMHREKDEQTSMDSERNTDDEGKPVLKR